MDYRIKVYIPTRKNYGYIEELKNKHILAISKYIKADDDYGLNLFFNSLLKDLNLTNSIDKFCVLLQLRGLNLNGKATLTGKHSDGGKVEYSIDIFGFLGEYLEKCESFILKDAFEFNNTKILFKNPSTFYFKNVYALLSDIIDDIEVEGVSKYKQKDKKEKFKTLLQLDKELVSSFVKHLDAINKKSDLFLVRNDNPQIYLPNIKISFFNNTIFNILKSLFKIELSYFYQKFYICLTKLGLSYKDFMELSFVETDILITIFKSANKIK